jgi:hypothetical protein
MFSKILNHKTFFSFSILLFASNIFFLKLPLVNVFGFELSVVNAFILCILIGLLRISHLRKITKGKKDSTSFFKQSILLLAIPFIISVINSLFNGFCSFCDGLIFYLLITFVSAFVGVALATLAYSFLKNISVYLVFILIIILVLLIAIAEIYFNPQIYLYNPVFGYFPGTIYDEGLRPFFKLFIYRTLNFSYFGIIFFLFRASAKITLKSKFIRLGIVSFVAIIFYFLSPIFGYSTTHYSLKNNLPVKLESQNFILNTNKIVSEDSLVILSAEFYHSELRKYFELSPGKKINIYLFESGESKKKLFGSDNADVAKPWLYEVYVSRENWQRTLKHEIAHCFTAPFGSTIFQVAADFNPALIEGAAESADGFYDDLPIHYLAKTAFKNGYQVNLRNLFTPGFNFFNQNSSLSYIYAGSFCKYLANKFGIQKFMKLYRDGFSDNIYDKSLGEIITGYESFLDSLEYETNQNVARYYFGIAGIFSKYCPRYYEDKITEAWNELNNKEYEKSKNIFSKLLENSNNYGALVGLVTVFENSNDLKSAIGLVISKIGNYKNSAYYYLLKLKLADLYGKNHSFEKAGELYKELVSEKPSLRIDFICLIRLALLEKNNSLLQKYLSGSDYDKYLVLKRINNSSNKYFCFPVMIELSQRVEEDYQLFLDYFENRITVLDYWSSFAMIKLSEYMLANLDYLNARKISTVALRFNSDPVLFSFTEENQKKNEWIFQNYNSVFSHLSITDYNN